MHILQYSNVVMSIRYAYGIILYIRSTRKVDQIYRLCISNLGIMFLLHFLNCKCIICLFLYCISLLYIDITGTETFLAPEALAQGTCKVGYYQTKKGKTDCICCHIGHYCPLGAAAPIPCPKGTYQPSNAECLDRGECIPCGKGEYQDEPGQSTCKCCTIGHRCPDPKEAPIPCEPGTIQNKDKCSERTKCYPAWKGYFQSQSGQPHSLCCPAGFFCPNETTVSPVPCPPGTYQEADDCSQRDKCYDCKEGTYQDKSGQSSCKTCPPGHKCPDKTGPPIPCEVGTAQTASTVSGRTTCYKCAGGYYQNETGQESCVCCPAGHVCNDNKMPEPCPPGQYESDPCRSRTKCYSCNKGYYQDKPGQGACMCCPVGHQCQNADMPPVPCEPGTVSYGSCSDRYICSQCSRGYYQEKAGQTECNCCPDGHRCGRTDRLPIPCEPGTVQSESCSLRYKCWDCNAGYYQDEGGQKVCKDCPPGYYCPNPGHSCPIPCPAGYYNNEWRKGGCFSCGVSSSCVGSTTCGTCTPGPSVQCAAITRFLDFFQK